MFLYSTTESQAPLGPGWIAAINPVTLCIADAGWAWLTHAMAYNCQLQGHHFIVSIRGCPVVNYHAVIVHEKEYTMLTQL